MGEKEGNTAQPQRMKFYDAQTGELLGRTAGSWGEYFQISFLENFYKKNLTFTHESQFYKITQLVFL